MEVLLNLFHRVVDYTITFTKLLQNREVGWQTVDRKTGRILRERQPLLKKLRLLLLFSPLMEWLDTTTLFRRHLHTKAIQGGQREEDPSSKSKIRPFVEFYGIDMEQFEPSDVEEYRCFQDFFIRHHKPGARPIHKQNEGTVATVVADCRMVCYATVPLAQRLWIKGRDFSLANLLASDSLAAPFNNGSIASFRLSPQDYHRFHAPVRGRVKWWKTLLGDYYLVDPLAIRSKVDVLCLNHRSVVCFETEEFGEVVFVAIGAAQVGTVTFSEKITKMGGLKEGEEVPEGVARGEWFEKGEEVGFFEFGGSSILVVFQEGRVRFDEDLVELSRSKVEIDVEVGMSLGVAMRPGV